MTLLRVNPKADHLTCQAACAFEFEILWLIQFAASSKEYTALTRQGKDLKFSESANALPQARRGLGIHLLPGIGAFAGHVAGLAAVVAGGIAPASAKAAAAGLRQRRQ